MEEQHHANLLADPHTWVLFSAILFAVVAWIKGKKPFLALLDGRTARISAELAEAMALKTEAERLLAEYEEKHRDAVTTSQKIIEQAQESAAQMKRNAEQKLDESLRQREAALLERIKRAEAMAVRALRAQAADLASAAAEKLLTEQAPKRAGQLIDEAVESLPKKLG